MISYSIKEGISQSNIPTVKHIQRNWDAPLCEICINSLIKESINLTEKARLLAVSAEHSGDWLNAIPIPSLGLKLDNNQLRISCGLRLGTILCHPHKCVCGSLVDETGRHGLSCKKSSGRYARHAHINDLIRRSLQSIKVPSTLEPVGLSIDDGKRPDGMTLFPWKKGKKWFGITHAVTVWHKAIFRQPQRMPVKLQKTLNHEKLASIKNYCKITRSFRFV